MLAYNTANTLTLSLSSYSLVPIDVKVYSTVVPYTECTIRNVIDLRNGIDLYKDLLKDYGQGCLDNLADLVLEQEEAAFNEAMLKKVGQLPAAHVTGHKLGDICDNT